MYLFSLNSKHKVFICLQRMAWVDVSISPFVYFTMYSTPTNIPPMTFEYKFINTANKRELVNVCQYTILFLYFHRNISFDYYPTILAFQKVFTLIFLKYKSINHISIIAMEAPMWTNY